MSIGEIVDHANKICYVRIEFGQNVCNALQRTDSE